MNIQEELEQRRQEERELQLTRFSNEDALNLGLTVLEKARERGAAVVIEIQVNGIEIFHYAMPGTNERQCMWVRRKANTVRAAQVSSLHAAQLLESSGQDLWADWRMDIAEYAAMGGGFPIALRGTGIIGSLSCSGLPHREDHRLLTDALRAFLSAREG